MDPKIEIELAAFATEVTGSTKVRVVGTSMRPLLKPGMIAEIEPPEAALRTGDLLVFRSGRGLIVHRIVGRQGPDGYLTCGDACPENPEYTHASAIVGRVRAIWRDDAATRRVDGPLFRFAGSFLARTRSPRATVALSRRIVRLMLQRPRVEPAFRAMVGAAIAFERGDAALGLERLTSVSLPAILSVARRHNMGGFLQRWLDEAAERGLEVPSDAHAAFQKMRWFAALTTAQVSARAIEVLDLFRRAGIAAVLLKGAARTCAGETDADINLASDVDVLVAADSIERAVASLRTAGYRERTDAHEIRFYRDHERHRAALWPAQGSAPVEIHLLLCSPGSVSQRLDYAALAPYVREVDGPFGRVPVLDPVAAALHLAYHVRDLLIFRDIVLLARCLRRMSTPERAKLEELVGDEHRDATRLRSAMRLAESLTAPCAPRPDEAAYVSWAIVREDLQAPLRKRAAILEAVFGRVRPFYRGLSYTLGQPHRWLYNVLATPVIVRWLRENESTFGRASELLGPSAGALLEKAEGAKFGDESVDVLSRSVHVD